MGTCGQSGYVFRDFVSIRVSILSFFVLIGVSISSIFVLNRGIDLFLDDKQPARMFYKLQQNLYLLLSYTGHGFGLNVQEKFQIPVNFLNLGIILGKNWEQKLPKLGKCWEVKPLLRSQKRDVLKTI